MIAALLFCCLFAACTPKNDVNEALKDTLKIEILKIQIVTSGDPGVVGIHGRLLSLGGLGGGAKGIVHSGQKIRIYQIVRIKHAISVISRVAQGCKGVMQRVSLISHGPQAGQNLCASLPGSAFGIVCAVVGDDIHIKQFPGIVLVQKLLHRPADDRFLIPGRQ